MRSLELTLAILKPDLLLHPIRLQAYSKKFHGHEEFRGLQQSVQPLNHVKQKIIQENFWIIKWKILRWSRKEAQQFYHEHKDRFFYKRLTSFMSSGPIMPIILARENAISQWRTLMGPTKTTKAKQTHPHSIRALYGLSDTRNATHGSDSYETAAKEIKYFFPEFDIERWLRIDMKLFQNERVLFNNTEEVHKVKPQHSLTNEF